MARNFSLARYKQEFLPLIENVDKKTLARWAINCAERVMFYYVNEYPDDPRPRKALQILEKWIETGQFKMSTIRAASLASHAAAREVGVDNPARSVARATGHAVATAHVAEHAIGSAIYALQAINRANDSESSITAVSREMLWQKTNLLELSNRKASKNGASAGI